MQSLRKLSAAFLFLITFQMGLAKAQTEQRTIGDFNALKIQGAFDVELIQGDNPGLKLEGATEDMQNVKTEVADGTLIISSAGKEGSDVKVLVTAKQLRRITLNGSSSLKSEGNFKVDNLDLSVGGAGNLSMDLNSGTVTVEASGAGDVKLKGSTGFLKATVSGAGDLRAYDLQVKKAIVKSSGAGDARVNVSDSLDADVSGAGSIIYKGNPAERKVEISGSGSVSQSNSSGTVEVGVGGNGQDTTRIKWKGKKLIIIEEKAGKDTAAAEKKVREKKPKKKEIWGGFELGVNGYLSNDDFDMPAGYDFLKLDYRKSYVINLNVLEHSFKLYKNYVMLTTGLGLEFNRYAFRNETTLYPGQDTLGGFISFNNFQKNVLKANYITAPLYLHFNTSRNPKKSFHLALGAVGGYNYKTFTLQEFNIGKTEYEQKVRDDFHVNPFKVSASARIGYGRFNIFANYGLNSLFEKKAAPELIPFSVGVTLLGF